MLFGGGGNSSPEAGSASSKTFNPTVVAGGGGQGGAGMSAKAGGHMALITNSLSILTEDFEVRSPAVRQIHARGHCSS